MTKSNNNNNNSDNDKPTVKELQERSFEAVIDNRVTQIELLKINPK